MTAFKNKVIATCNLRLNRYTLHQTDKISVKCKQKNNIEVSHVTTEYKQEIENASYGGMFIRICSIHQPLIPFKVIYKTYYKVNLYHYKH